MFEYDKFYDYLFNDEEFLNIIYKFHSSFWNSMDIKARNDLIQSFINRYCEIFKMDYVKMQNISLGHNAGIYEDLSSVVSVSKDGISSESQYDVMDTLFHELRHNFQHRAVDGNLSDIEYASEKQIKDWKVNFLNSPMGFSNYISNVGENGRLYYYQPVEEDAFKTGLSCTKKAYGLMKEKYGDDKQFVVYARRLSNTIMIYFSDEDLYRNNREEKREEVFKLFNTNNKKFEDEKKCIKIANKTMEKNLEGMSFEEINSLLSVYVWGYLDDDYKIEVLKEYDRRINKNTHVKIEKKGNSGIKINKDLFPRNDILSILNMLFTYEFQTKVSNIINGLEDCNPKLKEEIKINMYTNNGKLINYVKDSENFLLYSIQPFALLEGKVVLKQFLDIKKAQENIYGVTSDEYESMIDFYDYDKYIPYIEKFYGKSFNSIYNEQLKEMKKKIIEVKKNNRK